ncbi:MAG TPA: hypothetical protein VJ902_05750 [Wenzhouxiangellaceae bacterium]|nr:hypothetical protein [Wenzhouxiangellaceae bacterium]
MWLTLSSPSLLSQADTEKLVANYRNGPAKNLPEDEHEKKDKEA